jgi:hypothetical protein
MGSYIILSLVFAWAFADKRGLGYISLIWLMYLVFFDVVFPLIRSGILV